MNWSADTDKVPCEYLDPVIAKVRAHGPSGRLRHSSPRAPHHALDPLRRLGPRAGVRGEGVEGLGRLLRCLQREQPPLKVRPVFARERGQRGAHTSVSTERSPALRLLRGGHVTRHADSVHLFGAAAGV